MAITQPASALQLAKQMRANPREVANRIVTALPASPWIESTEIAGAGFINIRLTSAAKQAVVGQIHAQREGFGTSGAGQGRRVMVEFVSANPTGPLHVGHGRQAATGDAIASLLTAQGWNVYREFYYNDAGEQINNLTRSVQARLRQLRDPETPFPEAGYHGEYVREIAQGYLTDHPEDPTGENSDAVRLFAVAALRWEQDQDLAAFGVRFDNYYLESSLYTEGLVEQTGRRISRSPAAPISRTARSG
jgi:arginyl-tRNA synthetase